MYCSCPPELKVIQWYVLYAGGFRNIEGWEALCVCEIDYIGAVPERKFAVFNITV